MRAIVTLTTDFGLRDPFVAVMKGMILRRAPDTVIVDVTHDIAPFRAAGPVADMVGPMPYSQVSSLADPFAPPGRKLYERWDTLRALPDDVIDSLIERAHPENSLGNVVIIKQLNGAAGRVAPTATAFPRC